MARHHLIVYSEYLGGPCSTRMALKGDDTGRAMYQELCDWARMRNIAQGNCRLDMRDGESKEDWVIRVACAKYYAEHQDECRARRAKYYAEHRDEIKAYDAKYRAEHQDEKKAYDVKYRAEHRDEKKAYYAKYRAEHPDEKKAYNAKYYAEHREEFWLKLYQILNPPVTFEEFCKDKQLANFSKVALYVIAFCEEYGLDFETEVAVKPHSLKKTLYVDVVIRSKNNTYNIYLEVSPDFTHNDKAQAIEGYYGAETPEKARKLVDKRKQNDMAKADVCQSVGAFVVLALSGNAGKKETRTACECFMKHVYETDEYQFKRVVITTEQYRKNAKAGLHAYEYEDEGFIRIDC